VNGTVHEADQKLFDSCNPVILKPGRYVRSCRVPRAQRLFIGYGVFEPTRKALDRDWQQTRWELSQPAGLGRNDATWTFVVANR
jgi:hypothetical protein